MPVNEEKENTTMENFLLLHRNKKVSVATPKASLHLHVLSASLNAAFWLHHNSGCKDSD